MEITLIAAKTIGTYLEKGEKSFWVNYCGLALNGFTEIVYISFSCQLREKN